MSSLGSTSPTAPSPSTDAEEVVGHSVDLDAAAAAAAGVVLIKSEKMPEGSPIIEGYDFNKGLNYDALFSSLLSTGFQATQFGMAIEEVNRMIRWRLSDEKVEDDVDDGFPIKKIDPSKVPCTIFLGYTSNMISAGTRESIRFLCQHKMVSAIVTTCGGIEEDFMKCFAHHYRGDFHQRGREMRVKGLNRIGNMIVPNLNYCQFEDWINPILSEIVDEQCSKGRIFTPSAIVHRMGQRIHNEQSVYYWCSKNNIPVFCPALTDGSVGDMIFFFNQQREKGKKLIVDIAADIEKLNNIALLADKSGAVILGGGVIKHHIMNANLMRNGADFTVFINTGIEYDGSDSGADPDEAVSWGKIKLEAKPVKVYGDASLLFPLLVAQTFAKHHQNSPCRVKEADVGKQEVPKEAANGTH